ncbi:hypothetical protein A2110_00810 [Candidatus Jorgensenbacteria bacterium GWA1_54_12]|uniref:Large ribosomal subunit protein uL22 n=1 Tax=Candidatus Jorgensenbacteria bacterium GWA1_54_12 TaxID=1798468 RepID=A0A1F6BLM6_9BACT|nr:MAG: hypothetical protein A2110_00810 [Candidatus Jorgensenbacteria bacterium GWA1_54_12]
MAKAATQTHPTPDIKATLRFLHVAPQKVRRLTGLMRGVSVLEAEAALATLPQRAARPLLKLLHSACENARSTRNISKDRLYVARIMVDGGPVLKRVERLSRGGMSILSKSMSHVSLTLGEREAKPLSYRVPHIKKEKTKPEKKTERAPSRTSAAEPQAQRKSGRLQRLFQRKSMG